MTQVFLTSPTGSNQSWTSDATWDNNNNSVEIIGAGGSGGAVQEGTAAGTTNYSTGGGGGEYGKKFNFSIATPGTTAITYRVGTGGAAVFGGALGVAGATNGNAGGDSWWDGTTQAGATLGAIGGGGGNATLTNVGTLAGGVGGTGGVGDIHFAGGAGGTCTSSTFSSSGGGGAGGRTAAGVTAPAAATGAFAGGAGNGSTANGGGAAGAGSSVAGTVNAGGNGTNFDATHGSGGGGGNHSVQSATVLAGAAGGLYGGGGGGCANGSNSASSRATSGAGGDGIIALTWPITSVHIDRTANADPGASPVTVSAVPIGAAAADRIIVFCYTGVNGIPSAVTIDYGAGAKPMQALPTVTFGIANVRMFWASAPTGTTADFAITGGAVTFKWYSTYRVVGAGNFLNGSNTSTDMDATAPLTTGTGLLIPAGGAFLACVCGASINNKTWANVTEDLDLNPGSSFTHTTAFRNTALSGTAITCTGSVNGEDGAMTWLVFNPLIPKSNLLNQAVKRAAYF